MDTVVLPPQLLDSPARSCQSRNPIVWRQSALGSSGGSKRQVVLAFWLV